MSAPGASGLVGLTAIDQAASRIADLVVRTPLLALPHPAGPHRRLWCKAESLQPTGAFKLRGAANAILGQLPRARSKGVVAQSSGNHARAVAYLARHLGLDAVIVMPDTTPAAKVDAVRALGPRIEIVPPDQRDVRPLELAEDHGHLHVPPYDDALVIAGQGTIGRELAEDLPDLDTVLVPVSGGGLISGVATALKALRPGVRVVGVEPELAADAAAGLRSGNRVEWSSAQTHRTVADGLRTTCVGVLPWEHIRRHVDDIVTVTDDQILAAMRHLALAGRLVAEPSGAAAAAAWLHEVPGAAARSSGVAAAVVSGGSVDPLLLADVLTGRDGTR